MCSELTGGSHGSHLYIERQIHDGRSRSADAAPVGPPRHPEHDRDEIRLRDGVVWRLHGAHHGEATRSCITPVSSVAGKKITTIEGLSADGSHPVQKAWIEEDVPQCGYCQSGQIMSAVALLAKKPNPSDVDIDNAMSGNICRCGTYQRIRKAIHRAASLQAAQK